MKHLILIILFFAVDTLSGQEFLSNDPHWYVRVTQPSPAWPHLSFYSLVYRINGKEVIDGKEYSIVEVTRDSSLQNWRDSDYRIRETKDTIYYYGIDNIEKVYMIDNWKIGTEKEDCFESARLISKDTIVNTGITYIENTAKGPWLDTFKTIENVGIKKWMFVNSDPCVTDVGPHHIKCLYRDGRLVYKDGDKCFEKETTTKIDNKEITEIHLKRNIYRIGEEVEIELDDNMKMELLNLNGQIERSVNYPNERMILNSRGMKFIRLTTGNLSKTFGILVN